MCIFPGKDLGKLANSFVLFCLHHVAFQFVSLKWVIDKKKKKASSVTSATDVSFMNSHHSCESESLKPFHPSYRPLRIKWLFLEFGRYWLKALCYLPRCSETEKTKRMSLGFIYLLCKIPQTKGLGEELVFPSFRLIEIFNFYYFNF